MQFVKLKCKPPHGVWIQVLNNNPQVTATIGVYSVTRQIYRKLLSNLFLKNHEGTLSDLLRHLDFGVDLKFIQMGPQYGLEFLNRNRGGYPITIILLRCTRKPVLLIRSNVDLNVSYMTCTI